MIQNLITFLFYTFAVIGHLFVVPLKFIFRFDYRDPYGMLTAIIGFFGTVLIGVPLIIYLCMHLDINVVWR